MTGNEDMYKYHALYPDAAPCKNPYLPTKGIYEPLRMAKTSTDHQPWQMKILHGVKIHRGAQGPSSLMMLTKPAWRSV